MRKLVYLILLASVVLLNACSSGGSDSPSDSNVHPDGWFSTHAAEAIAIADGSPASLRDDPVAMFAHVVDMLVTPTPALASLAYENCTTCHGPDLRGSGDAVSCYSCHSYNPAPPFSTHPPEWDDTYTDHGGYATTNGADSCTACHGSTLQGYQTAPSCFSESFDGRGCHPGGPGSAPHPINAEWLLPSGINATSHVLASINDNTSCLNCHITNGTDPACSQCHTAGDPNYSVGTCDSCHNSPPDSMTTAGGDVRPNREGAHNGHNGLTTQTADCSACHYDTGTNTLNHYDATEPANVLLLVTYNAKTGFANYNAAAETCSNVSCHGGQTTPVWLTGTLNVNTQCASCHELGTAAQTPEYNSYYSGRHSTHVSRADCSVCHDVGKLATNHFSGLNTPDFEGDPALTIADAIGYDSGASTCSTNVAGCHQGQTRSWAAGGGAPHPVGADWLLPSGDVSTSHVLASLDNNSSCSSCHITGGVDPTCVSCHNPDGPNYALGSCDSCHASPPDSVAAVGNNRPNREGAHGGHNVLTAQTTDCSACHNGAGTDTINHYDTTEPADVVLLNTYDAKTGVADYNAAGDTCSKVSCHGGQTTPIWLTGSLDINTQCESCHELGTAAQTPEYNSYYSGRHRTHVSRADCSLCHDVGKLATNHFSGLNTPAFEGDPALTIADAIGYDASASTCSTNLAGCHQGQTRSWEGGGGAPHPVGASWLLPSGDVSTSHVLASLDNNTSCSGCHITGGVDPTCVSCHNPDGPNYTLGSCDSCHASPPDSVAAVGNSRPNREGAHTEHNALPKVVGVCATCHDGAGTDTVVHYDTSIPADVIFLGITYDAKTGAASYAPSVSTCSNVSCHGGQTTPNWITGSLDVNTQCSNCHQAAPTQYNGYTNPDSNSHNFHIVDLEYACTRCHNTTTLATNHFTNLDTPAMEGPASATIGGSGTSIPAGNYVPGTRSCNPSCHGTEIW